MKIFFTSLLSVSLQILKYCLVNLRETFLHINCRLSDIYCDGQYQLPNLLYLEFLEAYKTMNFAQEQFGYDKETKQSEYELNEEDEYLQILCQVEEILIFYYSTFNRVALNFTLIQDSKIQYDVVLSTFCSNLSLRIQQYADLLKRDGILFCTVWDPRNSDLFAEYYFEAQLHLHSNFKHKLTRSTIFSPADLYMLLVSSGFSNVSIAADELILNFLHFHEVLHLFTDWCHENELDLNSQIIDLVKRSIYKDFSVQNGLFIKCKFWVILASK